MILAATPDAGYVFNGWGGDCSGIGTVNPGSGSLTWNATSGSGLYVNGTSVTLTAVPDPGYVFTGWSGTGCSGRGACTVLVTDTISISAGFAPATTLNVTFSGSGGGSVNSNPPVSKASLPAAVPALQHPVT